MNDEYYQVGGSVITNIDDVPVAAGGDLMFMPDDQQNTVYYGVTGNIGVGFGKPGAEVHVEWGKTITVPQTQFNIFDVAKKVYTKIMEW